MIRIFWLALSAVAAFLLAPALVEILAPSLAALSGTALPADQLVNYAAHISAAGLIFGVAGCFAPGLIDAIQTLIAERRLTKLEDDIMPGSGVTEDEFRSLFTGSPFLDRAASEAARKLGLAGDPENQAPATLSTSRFFGPAATVRGLLSLWLFRPLPTLLWGLGAVFAILTFSRSGQTNPNLMISTAAWAAVLPALSGVILQVLIRFIEEWRITQARTLSIRLDNLLRFHPIQAMENIVLKTSQTQAETIESTLSEPLARLTRASVQLSEDQSAQVQQLLRSTLKSFVGELQGLVHQQMDDIHKLLQGSTATAQKLEQSLSETVETVSKFSTEQTVQLRDALENYRSALASFDERTRAGFEADFSGLFAKLDAGAINFQNSMMEIEAFKRSLAPLLEDISATQKSVLAATEAIRQAPAQLPPLPASSETAVFDKLRAMSTPPAQTPELTADLGKLRSLMGDRDLPKL